MRREARQRLRQCQSPRTRPRLQFIAKLSPHCIAVSILVCTKELQRAPSKITRQNRVEPQSSFFHIRCVVGKAHKATRRLALLKVLTVPRVLNRHEVPEVKGPVSPLRGLLLKRLRIEEVRGLHVLCLLPLARACCTRGRCLGKLRNGTCQLVQHHFACKHRLLTCSSRALSPLRSLRSFACCRPRHPAAAQGSRKPAAQVSRPSASSTAQRRNYAAKGRLGSNTGATALESRADRVPSAFSHSGKPERRPPHHTPTNQRIWVLSAAQAFRPDSKEWIGRLRYHKNPNRNLRSHSFVQP